MIPGWTPIKSDGDTRRKIKLKPLRSVRSVWLKLKLTPIGDYQKRRLNKRELECQGVVFFIAEWEVKRFISIDLIYDQGHPTRK